MLSKLKLSVCVLFVTLYACSKKHASEKIIGKWELKKIEMITEDNFWFFDEKENSPSETHEFWEFTEGGMLYITSDDTLSNDSMPYSLFSGNDSIKIDGTACSIFKLNSKNLGIEFIDLKFGHFKMHFEK